MLADRTTLAQFLTGERRRDPAAGGDLDALILEVALACTAVAHRVARGTVDGPGTTGRSSGHGEVPPDLAGAARDDFLRATECGGGLAGMVAAEPAEPHVPPARCPRGGYLLVVDPLDGSSDLDVNAPAGSIFSILRAPEPGVGATARDFLQPGAAQVCAGYALYGPATMLVLTVGRGVHAFTLDRALGEFVLTRESIRLPSAAGEYAIDPANRRFWEPAVRRYVDDCLAGRTGPRHRDFGTRWGASLVAGTHRVLTRGGVFLHPRDTRDPAAPGPPRLLHQANPVALLVEQAGGAASTGRERVLDVVPSGPHQRVPLIFGTAGEVAVIDSYHREHNDRPYDSPLYGARGLFRVAGG